MEGGLTRRAWMLWHAHARYVAAKERATAIQMSKYDKQQKEIQRQRELIQRLSGGAQSGRAATAEKMLEKLLVHLAVQLHV